MKSRFWWRSEESATASDTEDGHRREGTKSMERVIVREGTESTRTVIEERGHRTQGWP